MGGLELGMERAGLGDVVWQVEIDEFRRSVLARHWPGAERHIDVRSFTPARGSAELICGGFPCRGISSANVVSRVGLEHAESGLWREYRRIIGECRPRWVIVENSPEWRTWVPSVRADLASLGYASVPLVVSAGFVGAPHPRPRAFVVAHADAQGEPLRAFDAEVARLRALPDVVRNWGGGGSPHAAVFVWLMGFPETWLD